MFVLTHHDREPLALGATTFTFVTDGPEAALERALAAAGGRDVHVAGGASAAQQYLAGGLADELHLHVAPILLGRGVRLFEGVDTHAAALVPLQAVGSDAVTHLSYRVER